MLNPPPKGRLVTRKLIDYRLALYGSRDYLERKGMPATRADLSQYGFISYIDDLVGFPEMIALDELMPSANICFRASSSAAQYAAIAAGVGLGMLHVFATSQDDRLVQILPSDMTVRRSYWLVMHADLEGLPRVRAVVDFLDEIMGNLRDRF
jgi:DNA-binding transcriptional LysR family regulator